MNGFKGIESLSSQSKNEVSDISTLHTATEDNETSKSEAVLDDANTDTEEKPAGPELPLPVPNLF